MNTAVATESHQHTDTRTIVAVGSACIIALAAMAIQLPAVFPWEG